MRSKITLLLLAAVLVLSGCQSGTQIYYVSPGGDDSAPGTSAGKAWQTISRVNQEAFNPGDRILFEGGQTFEGSLQFDREDSGTPGNPVMVGSFGSGRAIINSGDSHGLHAVNTSGLAIENLVFKGAGAEVDADFSGIVLFTDLDSVKPEFIRIDHAGVSGYRWDGISIRGARKGNSGFRDVRITNTEVHDCGDKGISVSGPQPPGDWGNKDIYIGNCSVFNIRGIPGKKGHSGNGIIVSSVDSCLIEYCSAYDNGQFSDDPDTGGPIGIWAWDARGVIIQYCESYHNRTGNRADGGGFDLDGGCVNCIMQYNYSHGNDGAGYGIYQYRNAREFKNNIVRYNISENDGVKNRHGGINLWSTNSSGGIQNTLIHNNTIFVSEHTNGAAIEDFPDEQDTSYIYGTQVYNNIFIGVPGKKLVNIPHPSDQYTFSGNCYWTYDDRLQIRWGDKTFSSLDEWRGGSSQEKLAGTDTGFEADPGLTDPGHGGKTGEPGQLNRMKAYMLESSSVLIDNGLDLNAIFGIDPGPHDFYGTPVPAGRKYDIGAHEYRK